jgi:hypothetical protein
MLDVDLACLVAREGEIEPRQKPIVAIAGEYLFEQKIAATHRGIPPGHDDWTGGLTRTAQSAHSLK